MILDPTDAESTCVAVTAADSEEVHLALQRSGDAQPSLTLCARPVLPAPPTHPFQEAGCRACARVSLERGIDCASETGHIVVNLRRFYDRGGYQEIARGAAVV